MTEGAKQDAEDVKAALQQTIDDGWLVWPTASGAESELAAFKAWTLPEDDEWVLKPDYLPMLKAGVYPPLQCMVLFQAADAAGLLPGAYEPTFFWAQLFFREPPFVWEHYASRYRSLTRAEMKAAT